MWGETFPAILGRWALFLGLLTLVGSWGFRVFVAPSTKGGDGAAVARVLSQAARIGGVLLLLGVLARLGFQLLDFMEPGEPLGPQLHFLVVELFWGRVWMAQLGLSLLALLLLPLLLPREGGWVGGVTGVMVLGLALTPALSGHAIGAERFTALAVGADAAHVLAAGLWLGTLGVLLGAAFSLPSAGGVRDTAVRGWIEPFHRLALGSVGVLLLTGVFATWLHTDSPLSLLRTGWGFALVVKVGITAVVLGMGWRAGWRLRPRISEAGVPSKLMDSAMLELAVAQLVLIATATLVALSPVVEDHHFDDFQ